MKNYKKRAYITFWITILLTVVIVTQMFVDVINEVVGGELFLVPLLLISVTGGFLVCYARKAEWSIAKQKRFIMFAGIAALAFFPFVVAHNAFYAFGMMGDGSVFGALMHGVSTVTFIFAVVICPMLYTVGAIGTIWMLPHNVRK